MMMIAAVAAERGGLLREGWASSTQNAEGGTPSRRAAGGELRGLLLGAMVRTEERRTRNPPGRDEFKERITAGVNRSTQP